MIHAAPSGVTRTGGLFALHDASVVGDHLDGAWTKGADLMGDVELTYAPQAG